MKSWRNLPATLQVMFVVELVSAIGFATYDLVHTANDGSLRIMLAANATSFMMYVLGAAGFFELARQAVGRVALGCKITGIGYVLAIAEQVWWQIFQAWQPHWSIHTIDLIQGWMSFGVMFVPLLGIIIAASGKDPLAATIAGVVLFLTDPVPPMISHVYGLLIHGWKAEIVMFEVIRFVALVTTLAVAARLAVPAAQQRDGAYGLRTVSSGLWLRVIAACGVAGLTLLFALGRPGEGAISVLKLATLGSAIATALSFAMIARGALGARAADMPRELLVVAAAGALWCLGVTLVQLPYTYHMLYGGDGGFSYDAASNRELATALSVVAPLVAIAAIGFVARSIAGFAARRGLEQLRVEAQNKGLGFVTLMLAALGLQQWLLPNAESESSLMFMLVAAAACSLWATVLMARLCSLAADSLAVEPGLPTATLRS